MAKVLGKGLVAAQTSLYRVLGWVLAMGVFIFHLVMDRDLVLTLVMLNWFLNTGMVIGKGARVEKWVLTMGVFIFILVMGKALAFTLVEYSLVIAKAFRSLNILGDIGKRTRFLKWVLAMGVFIFRLVMGKDLFHTLV